LSIAPALKRTLTLTLSLVRERVEKGELSLVRGSGEKGKISLVGGREKNSREIRSILLRGYLRRGILSQSKDWAAIISQRLLPMK
jgi:hypothetical protein